MTDLPNPLPFSLSPAVQRARDFAVTAHKDHSYGGQPYWTHLDTVASILHEFGWDSPSALQAAYLHDAVEDCENIDAKVLQNAGFSQDVVEMVLFCTDEQGPNRKTRKKRTYQRMKSALQQWQNDANAHPATPWGVRVKLADRLANVRQCVAQNNQGLLAMYRRESETFRQALFIPGMADAMWSAYEALQSDSHPRA